MQDTNRDLNELKREIIESRNQAIKTDNQVKNLTMDIKGFEQRFDSLESRVRLSGLGVNILVAVVVAAAGFFVSSVTTRSLTKRNQTLQVEKEEAVRDANEKIEGLRTRLTSLETEKEARARADKALTELLEHTKAGVTDKAVNAYERLDGMALSPFQTLAVSKQLDEVRRRAADKYYKTGRSVLDSDTPQAVKYFKKSLAADSEGRYADRARYFLITQLWPLKRFEEVLPLIKTLKSGDTERALLDELRYYEATALARLGRPEPAKRLFRQAIGANSRYESSSRAYLEALEAGNELPPFRSR